MKKQQTQILITLLGVIILLLIVVIIIFALKKDNAGGQQAAAVDTVAATSGVNQTASEPPVYREPDSVRVTDQIKYSAIESFFSSYSYANQRESTSDLVDLYVYPAQYQSKVYDRDKMWNTVSGFFDNTDAVEHYFTDLTAYEYRNGDVSAYVNEYHTTYDRKYGKETKYKVYKNFHLVQTGSGYKCREQHALSRAKIF